MTWSEAGADYSWAPAIVLVSVMSIFLMDFGAERYVDYKYGFGHNHQSIEDVITDHPGRDEEMPSHSVLSHNQMHSGDQDENFHNSITMAQAKKDETPSKGSEKMDTESGDKEMTEEMSERSFRQQIAAFLILEFGVIFHSVIIGLNLGTAGDEFNTLYPVLVFHQSFEGLGIGARMVSHFRPAMYPQTKALTHYTVRNPLPKAPILAPLAPLHRLRSHHPNRNRHRSRSPHNLQQRLLHRECRLRRLGLYVCRYPDLHWLGRAFGKRLLIQP